jgi:hypothetical protein
MTLIERPALPAVDAYVERLRDALASCNTLPGHAMILGPHCHLSCRRPDAAALVHPDARPGAVFRPALYVGFSVGGFGSACCLAAGPAPGPQPLWGVADIGAARAPAALGATRIEAVTEVGEGIKVAAVRDPFGNRFGLIENPLFDPKAVR